jgi:hypothetical protein
MEYNEAQKLKILWGKTFCAHPRLEKLYYAGAYLVNYTCINCGMDFTIAQKMEIDVTSKKQNENNNYEKVTIKKRHR